MDEDLLIGFPKFIYEYLVLRRTVFDFQHADWNALHETLSHLDLAPGNSTNIDAHRTKWKDLFLGAAAKHIPKKISKDVPLLCESTATLSLAHTMRF